METSPPFLRRVFAEQLAESVQAPLPTYTARRVFGPAELPGKATTVVGMRRAGKTTFLHQLRDERIRRGVSKELLPFVSFEDERLAGLEAVHLELLVNEYQRRFPVARDGTVAWFFDEIRVVPGWERFVRRLLDSERTEVFVTGSSAASLSGEIAAALRGRAWRILLHPFSFEEALRFRSAEPATVGFLTGSESARMERALLDWLEAGGFPEAQDLAAAARRQLLRGYVDAAMLRDVMERYGVRNIVGLRWLVRHLLGNAGAPFSVEKFLAAIRSQGLAVAKDTLHRLLSHLEDCFLVRIVWMEASSERQRMVNPRKAYPVDPGLIPVFDRSGRATAGHALETAVLVELERRGFDVTYLRTAEGYEVDFLARGPDGGMELLQVCADLSDPATAAREYRALAAGGEMFPDARRLLLTLLRDGLPAEVPAGMEVRTACEWFLETAGGEVSGARAF